MGPQFIVFACVLRTIEFGPPPDERCHTPYVHELVTTIQKYSLRFNVPADIEAAKIYHESRFDRHALGAAGEVGLTQIKRHGAIQGADLRLTRRQLEVVDTNIRIGMQYLATFVQECDRPSRWLTKYNRPARGCRPSRYSLGVLTDLRRAREAGQQLALGSESSGPPESLSPQATRLPGSAPLSTSAPSTPTPSRTSDTAADSDSTMPSDIRERLPSGIRRATTPWESKLEERLAAPFQEP